MFAVIMAGGGGTRLWPKSRETNPKQLHALVGEKPLVQAMTERMEKIVGKDQVFVITGPDHAEMIKKRMPFMSSRIFVDPYRRDTAPCIGLAAVYLSRLDPNAVMMVSPADHFIGSEEKFAAVVKIATELAEKGHVVTIGIKPTAPETGYGYIESGDLFATINGYDVYRVHRFVEKPDVETAKRYLAAGNFYWNSGMFAWSIPTILSLFEKHLPATYASLMRIRDALGTADEAEIVDREYKSIEPISVDFGIMEKLRDILVIPGDFEWSDIGCWSTVFDISPKDANGNAVAGLHIGIDTRNCLILSSENRLVATVGIEDMVVIDTEDAVLVCPRDRAQEVKKIVDKIKEAGLQRYL